MSDTPRAKVEQRHRDAAREWARSQTPPECNVFKMDIYAEALADQEAEIADALEAEGDSIEQHGTPKGPAATCWTWAKKLRDGTWRPR